MKKIYWAAIIELGKRYLNWFVTAARTRFYCLPQPVSHNAAHLFYLIVGQCIHSATAQRVGGHRGTRCISPDFFFLGIHRIQLQRIIMFRRWPPECAPSLQTEALCVASSYTVSTTTNTVPAAVAVWPPDRSLSFPSRSRYYEHILDVSCPTSEISYFSRQILSLSRKYINYLETRL